MSDNYSPSEMTARLSLRMSSELHDKITRAGNKHNARSAAGVSAWVRMVLDMAADKELGIERSGLGLNLPRRY